MASFKNRCSIHSFNYSGTKCPFCEQDRINHMVHKFEKKQIKVLKEDKIEDKPISQSDIERLINKFNREI